MLVNHLFYYMCRNILGDLLLLVFVYRRASCDMRRPLSVNKFITLTPKKCKANCYHFWANLNMQKKKHFKKCVLYKWEKTKFIMMSREPSTKIVKFTAPGSVLQAPGLDKNDHIVSMH